MAPALGCCPRDSAEPVLRELHLAKALSAQTVPAEASLVGRSMARREYCCLAAASRRKGRHFARKHPVAELESLSSARAAARSLSSGVN